jgi:hypothetical protein
MSKISRVNHLRAIRALERAGCFVPPIHVGVLVAAEILQPVANFGPLELGWSSPER